jgi:hypothetical protein
VKSYRLIILGLICGLLFTIGVVMAQENVDDEGNPNNPNISERANACFDGGSMAGKCDSDWEWNCGWYLIRFEYGIFSRDNFPTQCGSLLPEITTPSQSVVGTPSIIVPTPTFAPTPYVFPTAGCIFGIGAPSVGTDGYIDFGGGNFVLNPVYYLTTDCSGGSVGTIVIPLAYAPNGLTDAVAICIMNGYTTAAPTLPGINPVIYACS